MKKILIASGILLFTLNISAQVKPNRTSFVTGLSAPELIHAGVTYRIANISQIGCSGGIGPSWGELWTSLSIEHRLYFAKNSARTGQKVWFFRLGTTLFPKSHATGKLSVNATIGKDIPFKKSRNGFTMDAGVFYLAGSERSSLIINRSMNLWPALRFQFYFS